MLVFVYKELDDQVSCAKDYMWNPSTYIVSVIKHVKLMNNQI